MTRHTQCVVYLDRLADNLQAIRRAAPGQKVMAMVKADAYGHGMIPVASFLEGKADWFGVATADEGAALRQAGIQTPILHIEPLIGDEDVVVLNAIDQSVTSADSVMRLEQAAERLHKTVCVQIKIETGMHRTGVRAGEDLGKVLTALLRAPHTRLTGVFTHFACADDSDRGKTDKQAQIFMQAVEQIRGAGFDDFLVHCANSGAVAAYPEYHFDMVRAGIILYGYYPSDDMPRTLSVLPVMDVESEVLTVETVRKGESISYGGTFTATRDMRTAVVAVGYGDGYKRALSNNGCVLIGGKRAPIVGRICMDMLMADVTDIPGVAPGAPVVLIGKQGAETIGADELASRCGTISYEILTSFLPRVPKQYKGAALT